MQIHSNKFPQRSFVANVISFPLLQCAGDCDISMVINTGSNSLRIKNKLTISIAIYLVLSFLFISIISNKGGITDGLLLTVYHFSMPVMALIGYSTSIGALDFIINGFSLLISVPMSICAYKSIRYRNPEKDKTYEIIGIFLLVPWFVGAFLLLLFAHVH